jgi:hypothetical protein
MPQKALNVRAGPSWWQAGHMSERRSFRTAVAVDRQGRTQFSIPFDPNEVWGDKPRHHVTGSVADRPMRGVIEERIDSTKRRPDQRPIRIAEMVRLLQQGHKQRP